ncbi:MAG TPA: nucleoside triphosphate pyrophosphohydrolase [Thermoanaerobaculaceae bacterium]|nr:nucleoside triphosphate pyrophosphohydrolase [Thermoanaerobaculaceae bacterium]HRS17446.1 nucleoside triphosphate pyrophosphohydrolase [Thermoanaerobaculaceae bacterium]
MSEATAFAALVELCERLRGPGGCPWDREQTLESLRAYIIEEAYEVVDAISAGEREQLAGELGDLLFQIVFVAQIAREQGWFDVAEVCEGIRAKMIRRHPHVFGTVEVEGAAHVVRNWEAIKQRERARPGALAGVPRSLPALLKALRMSEKAAALGLEWRETAPPQGDIARALAGLGALAPDVLAGREERAVAAELGEALFCLADLARRLGIDPEAALQAANEEFARCFAAVEHGAQARGVAVRDLDPGVQRELWASPAGGGTAGGPAGESPAPGR